MSLQYRVYSNNGSGGPVDYTSIIATVSGLTWTSGVLALNSDTTFVVRAYDTVSGLEDKNTSSRVRIQIDGSGNDISGQPAAPGGLTARATSSGGAFVAWSFAPAGRPAPTGFHVYVGSPTPSYGSPAATRPYVRGRTAFTATLSGLTPGTTYQVAVRAYNGTGEETNTSTASFTASNTGPAVVDALTAT